VLDVLDAVAAACAGIDGLQAAIVFGSALTRTDPHDLDVALLWQEAIPRTERWQRAERIAATVEHRLAECNVLTVSGVGA